MKKLTILLLLLFVSLSAEAQLLWKISGKDLTRPSYILGTHHVAPLSIIDSIKGFMPVMDEVEQVYGEVAAAEMQSPDIAAKMQKAVLLPQGTTLQTLYTEEQYAQLNEGISSLMGVDLKMLAQYKPAFISAQISLILSMKSLKGFNPQQQLDTWVQQEATRRGKSTKGFETVDFQTDLLFNAQTLERQAEQLYFLMTNVDLGVQQITDLSEAYMTQDLDNLAEIIQRKQNNASDPTPEEEEKLIYGRNVSWMKQMPEIMRQKATLFVVGSGHLVTERGLLALLKKQGYTLEGIF